jgi:predicted O-methyltransferase YrrM
MANMSATSTVQPLAGCDAAASVAPDGPLPKAVAFFHPASVAHQVDPAVAAQPVPVYLHSPRADVRFAVEPVVVEPVSAEPQDANPERNQSHVRPVQSAVAEKQNAPRDRDHLVGNHIERMAASLQDETQHSGQLRLRPLESLPARVTVRPIGIYAQERRTADGTPIRHVDATTVMGRLTFSRGSMEPAIYRPFSQDPHRRLVALHLPIETAPEDDRVVSPQRWANVEPIAADLLSRAGLAWPGLSRDTVQQLLWYVPHPDPIEACLLYAAAQHFHAAGSYFVEVGSFRGMSLAVTALALANCGSAAPLFSIDPHADQPVNQEHVRLALRQLGQEDRLVQIRRTSDEAAAWLKPASASLVLIDGDHSYEQVAADIANYLPLIAPGGCLLLHDYGFGAHTGGEDPHPGVRCAVDELLFDHPEFEPLVVAHTMLAFVRSCRS